MLSEIKNANGVPPDALDCAKIESEIVVSLGETNEWS